MPSATAESVAEPSTGPVSKHGRAPVLRVALLTGGGDRPYALGLASCLTAAGMALDFVGSDDLVSPEVCENPRVRFLNLRGNQRPDANPMKKALRVALYYVRLLRYVTTDSPRILHILWHNKFEHVDRTALLLYYRLLGKRLVMTVHNVNIGERDGTDGWLNRLTLRVQYRLLDHMFVHSELMRRQLEADFGIPGSKVTVIPFGINDTVPRTSLTEEQARQTLGLAPSDKVLLFFGNIAPYKGIEYLIDALPLVSRKSPQCRLVIAGRPKGPDSYWASVERRLRSPDVRSLVTTRIEYVPDEQTELFFKAADVLVLPYTYVFQSGVLFLGYSFGVAAIASDVGSLREEIVEGRTGYICPSRDPEALADAIGRYFESRLYAERTVRRSDIQRFASERHSWSVVGNLTTSVYGRLDRASDALGDESSIWHS